MIAPLPLLRTSPRSLLSRNCWGLWRWRACAATSVVTLLSLVGGCEQKPAVSLHQGTVSNADLDAAPEDPGKIEEVAANPGEWFEDPRGVAVIRARQRGDATLATSTLRELFATPGLSAHDRAGALVLLGRAALAAGRYEEAFASFQEAAPLDELASIRAWMMLQQADAALRGSQPQEGRAVLEAITMSDLTASQASRHALLRMRAMQRVGTTEESRASLEAFIEEYPEHEARFEAREALAALDEAKDPARARGLYESIVLAVPLSTFATRAREGLRRLDKAPATRAPSAERRAFARATKVATLESELSRRRYRGVVEDSTSLLADKRLTKEQRCRVAYARAKAIFRQRKRAKARAPFDAAGVACEAADEWNLVVKSRYQSARGRYAAGEYAKAAAAFEGLAAAFPQHSYADDALLLVGESWVSDGKTARAEEAWRRALAQFPEGDMYGEIQRRLMLSAFNADAPERVLEVVEGALVGAKLGTPDTAKLYYFNARALDLLGRGEEALTSYFAAIEAAPMSYPSALALSRLRDKGPEPLARGLARLESARAAPAPSSSAPVPPTATSQAAVPEQARVFAALGLGDETLEALDQAGIEGWSRALLLARAGIYRASQRALAGVDPQWRATPPRASDSEHWSVAHPRPFRDIIEDGEAHIAISPFLAYAIMQTESRFDPGAVSWAGARGLVQLMPATAKDLAARAKITLGPGDVHDPAINLELGMRYLARLTARFGGEEGAVALAIPSYNAGAGAVDRWIKERGDWEFDLFIEAIPYDETRKYVQSVLGRWMAYRWLYAEGPPESKIPFLPRRLPSKP